MDIRTDTTRRSSPGNSRKNTTNMWTSLKVFTISGQNTRISGDRSERRTSMLKIEVNRWPSLPICWVETVGIFVLPVMPRYPIRRNGYVQLIRLNIWKKTFKWTHQRGQWPDSQTSRDDLSRDDLRMIGDNWWTKKSSNGNQCTHYDNYPDCVHVPMLLAVQISTIIDIHMISEVPYAKSALKLQWSSDSIH